MPLNRSCPVCGASNAPRLHHQRFALPKDHPLPDAFDIVACSSCDFVFADSSAAADDYDNYYTNYSKYADQTTSTGGGGNPLDLARIEETAREIARHLPSQKARIVDIGCANGGLLAALQKLGYQDLLGVDPSPDCVANTERLFGISSRQGSLDSLPNEANSSDLIILSHVLEHVFAPAEAISRIRNFLKKDGLIYAEVPDAARYAQCLAAPFQDFNTEHINHFGLESLSNLLSLQGFEPVAEGTKTLSITETISYPACFGFFRPAQIRTTRPPLRRAPQFLSSMVSYIANSTAHLERIDYQLNQVLQGGVIVWGVGQLTLKLLMETSLGSANIVAFTDSNPLHQEKTLWDRPILAPENLRELPPHPVLIGSLLHQDVIEEQIVRLGLSNPVIRLS